jgi:hypothetical protein
MLWSAITLGLVALACGGGGGANGSGSAPTISNLQYSPNAAVFNQGGGTIAINGTLDFSDPDGDVTTLRLTTTAGSQDTAIQGASGIKSGSLMGAFSLSTTQLGHFTFQVSLLDGKGHQSNSLSGGFDVVVDDGATRWSQHSAPAALSNEQFMGVAWSGTRYVAVGTHGAIMWSADAATWTQSTSPVTADLYRATWAGTQFVAVGDQGTILTSPDGVSWTARRSSGTPGNILYGVAWSGSALVAVGVNPTTPWETAQALRSPDGVTWTTCVGPTNMSVYDSRLGAVASSGSGFVAVGNGTVTGSGGSGLVWTSTDGATWSASCPRADEFTTVTWGGGKYAAMGSGGGMSTSDGISWTPLPTTSAGYEVAWSGSHYLAILNIFLGTLYAPDFASPGTSVNLPDLWYGHGQLVWGGHQWVCPGASGTIYTSP